MQNLIELIRRREARCGIIGLGYVGLPLALEFARAGFRTTGIDVDARKVDAIRNGRSYIVDVTDAEIAEQVEAGRDICLAFSPERIDPGNAHFKTRNIPKVVGGVTRHCTEVAKTLYEQCVETVVSVSSPRVAEMVKLLENTFRSVNIGLVNEIALMSHALGIDVWEVIEAAKTKPFGFMAFYPGPGLGGHCIPIDPFYLSWKAKMNGFEPRFIELAGHINEGMPRFVVEKVTDALNAQSRSVRGSRIHVLGVAYKPGVNDTRESPALNVMRLLQDKGAILTYSDPYVPALREDRLALDSLPLGNGHLGNVDCVVILTHHREFDYAAVARTARLVVDTRNALAGLQGDNIVRL